MPAPLTITALIAAVIMLFANRDIAIAMALAAIINQTLVEAALARAATRTAAENGLG